MPAAQVTDSTFNLEVLDSVSPVLVYFWAPWSITCHTTASVVDDIADSYKDQLKVVKINTDDNTQTASNYGIRGLPTLIIFKDGQKMETSVGAVPKSTLVNLLETYF